MSNNKKLIWGGVDKTPIPKMIDFDFSNFQLPPGGFSLSPPTSPSVYTIFDQNNDVVENMQQTVSSGMWTGGSGTLSSFYTSSTQSGSNGEYYYNVYQANYTSASAEVQFSVSYGHLNGSGSEGGIGDSSGNRASAAIYRQMRNMLLGPNDNQFTFAPSKDKDQFYMMSINRSRLREKMDPGNWELTLTKGAKTIHLIDDSGATTNPSVNSGGRVFNIVSGSISTGTAVYETTAANETVTGAPGLFYPDLGIMILNADWLDGSGNLALATVTGSDTNNNNSGRMFDAIDDGVEFIARREENINSTHYFCRANNKKYNFSTNPTFFTGSDGSFTNTSFFKDPKTYITTVGLYNNSNELLAVAKLSKPLLKSYSREAIIKIKLDF